MARKREQAIENKKFKNINDPAVSAFLAILAEIIVEEILTAEEVQGNEEIKRAGNIGTSKPSMVSPF
ncbi:MAG: hypothetical protein L0Y56_18950 [Nitrospira sp.]|nr:hypothetical protein [Nitrospira sp.]